MHNTNVAEAEISVEVGHFTGCFHILAMAFDCIFSWYYHFWAWWQRDYTQSVGISSHHPHPLPQSSLLTAPQCPLCLPPICQSTVSSCVSPDLKMPQIWGAEWEGAAKDALLVPCSSLPNPRAANSVNTKILHGFSHCSRLCDRAVGSKLVVGFFLNCRMEEYMFNLLWLGPSGMYPHWNRKT